ncbi:oligosaccharide flippase family protein [Mesobacillus maritimus]|uniref:lipopolysaccharide biosynthesis protein n=1 Tax=Mesobacillus maritimus TaxID=1643336 RepID=UPI0020426A96|nr:oligosaccharide flippase family protein [Mesobacillus maritimus]MCM3586981.1 oligosaccharide flippase family protein [Mesobacillus maritimus]
MRRNFVLELSKAPFVRNVVLMATGTAAAQVVTMVFSPFITRLYGPEVFGVLGVFMAIVGVVAPIAALNYPIAIVLPKSDRDAKGLIYISILVSLIIVVLTSIIIIVFDSLIVKIFRIQAIEPFLYLIPVVILSSALFQVVQQWLIRTKQYRVIAKFAFLHAIILNASKVGIGLLNPVATVLIIISALANALHALMLYAGSPRTNGGNLLEKYKVTTLKLLGKKYIDFPLYRAPQVFINSISQSIPILLLSSFFGPASVGFYSIARTVLQIPTGLIGKSLSDVLYPRIAEKANKGESFTNLLVKGTLALVALGIFPFGIVVVFGPWLFGFVFGDEWVLAGEYARWMALWMFFLFINRPSVSAIPVLNMQSSYLIYEVISILFNILALIIGVYFFENDIIAILLYSVSGSITYIYLIIWVIQSSKQFRSTRV